MASHGSREEGGTGNHRRDRIEQLGEIYEPFHETMAARNFKDFYLGEASLYAGNSTKTPEEGIEWFFLPFSPVSSSWLQREEQYWLEGQRKANERAARMDIEATRRRGLTRLREEGKAEEQESSPQMMKMKESPTK